MRIRHKPKPFAMRMRPPWSVGVTTAMAGEMVDMAISSTGLKDCMLHVRAPTLLASIKRRMNSKQENNRCRWVSSAQHYFEELKARL